MHVVAEGGSSSGSGSSAEPLQSLQAAVAAVRQRRSRLAAAAAAPARCCIVLHSGTHYLHSTVQLLAEDSGLVITGAPGEGPTWLSGGEALLGLSPWRPVNVSAGSNIWASSVPASIPVRYMPALNTLEPLARLTDSQFPNYDAETETLEVPGPWGGGGPVVEWLKPGLFPLPTVFWKDLGSLKNDSTMDCYNHFSTGRGGACAHWKGQGSEDNYYCGNSSDGGWVEVDANMNSIGLLLLPLGMTYNSSLLPNLDGWQLPPRLAPEEWAQEGSGPALTVWQGAPGGGGEWYNNRFAIISHSPASHFLNLSR